MYLSKTKVEKILDMNDGFEGRKSYSGRNLSYTNHYKISDGKLYCRETGKTSWADSHFDNTNECTPEQTRNFIRNFFDKLNTEGLAL